MVIGAERSARCDQHTLALEPRGQVGARDALHLHPEEVCLGRRDRHPELGKPLEQLRPLLRHGAPPLRDLAVGDADGVVSCRLRERVDAKHRRDPRQEVRRVARADRVADSQTGQAVGLRERAEDREPRERLGQLQAGVLALDVLEVHERLVEQHLHVLGHL